MTDLRDPVGVEAVSYVTYLARRLDEQNANLDATRAVAVWLLAEARWWAEDTAARGEVWTEFPWEARQ